MSINRENLKIVAELLAPWKKKLGLLFSLSIFQAIVFTIFDPLALKYLIDAITEGNTRLFVIIALTVTAIATGGRWLSYWTSLLRQQIKNAVQQQVCAELTAVYYQHDCKKIDNHGKGYYISRLHDEPKQLAAVVDVSLSLLVGIVVAISGVGVALWISWQVTLALVVIVPMLYLLANKFSNKIGEVTNKMHESEAEFKSILTTVIDSFKLVKLFDLNDTATQEIKQGLKVPLEATYQSAKYASMYRSISAVFLSYAELSVIVIAGYQVITGVVTIGALFALTRAFSMVTRSVEQITSIIPSLVMLNTLIERYKAFKSESDGAHSIKREVLSGFSLKGMEYDHQGKSIFHNASLEIGAQSRVLISGPNGSGKSTFANLLAGFYVPDNGSISGPELHDLSASLYPFGLLPGTIGKNFNIIGSKYGCEDKVSYLVEELNLQPCLESKYDNLSEGQKKKCQIAMCLLKPAKTYLFDEPLANIDDKSKATVLGIIDRFTQGASLMMIMHEGERFTEMFDSSINIIGNGGITFAAMKS
ncbi:ABC transporter transmembrane domain-containing protein [Shewanella sp.]|uniref:ABC transporter transmembrane domain-containing protein n=1 Tax=Shewanella sp. TaxID=50422 RepID=UPI004054474C